KCGKQRRAECPRGEGPRRVHLGGEGRRVPPLRNEARTPIGQTDRRSRATNGWECAEKCGKQRRAECPRGEGPRRVHLGGEGRRVPPLRNEARTPIGQTDRRSRATNGWECAEKCGKQRRAECPRG